MSLEPDLSKIADNYRGQGFDVVVQPTASDLPDFAKDFRVELVGRRGNGGVLVSIFESHTELKAASDLERYAEVVESQADWRYDLVVLGRQAEPPEEIEGKEPTEQDVRSAMEEIRRMVDAGFLPQAFVAAWSLLEAAMRKRLTAERNLTKAGASPRGMLAELYSNGVLASADFRDLVGSLGVRNAVVHGFTPPIAFSEAAVQLLLGVTLRLLDEARDFRKTA